MNNLQTYDAAIDSMTIIGTIGIIIGTVAAGTGADEHGDAENLSFAAHDMAALGEL